MFLVQLPLLPSIYHVMAVEILVSLLAFVLFYKEATALVLTGGLSSRVQQDGFSRAKDKRDKGQAPSASGCFNRQF